ncbi:MAG: ATP-dependent Clp protease proteolytic subunit [Clostridiaceae bacterium]
MFFKGNKNIKEEETKIVDENDSIQNEIRTKQPPVLFQETQHLISKIEDMLGHKMIVYWTSERGGVCQNDVLALYEIFKKIGKNEKLSIFIKSDGGDVEAALRIVNLIRTYSTNVTALIPLECASSATMIALGANEISMGPLSFLTAIDSSIMHNLAPIDERDNRRVRVSQDELYRIVKLWENNSKEHHGNPYSDIFKYVHPLVIGALDRSSSLSIKICKEILSYHMNDREECNRISNHLNGDYPSHGYPITSREAKSIGLNITNLREDINNLLLELNKCYSEMAQRALTDYDEYNYHDNEILNILEASDIQLFYQNDKDWNYIKDERRWQVLNDESSWRKSEVVDGKVIRDIFYIA